MVYIMHYIAPAVLISEVITSGWPRRPMVFIGETISASLKQGKTAGTVHGLGPERRRSKQTMAGLKFIMELITSIIIVWELFFWTARILQQLLPGPKYPSWCQLKSMN